MKSPRPALILLPGWGMNARVFDALASRLDADFDVRAFDLPGHGGRAMLADNTLADWAADFASQLPVGASVLGWSLGGLVALRAALDHPARIARLVLLATTPRFVAAADWPHGIRLDDLTTFGAALGEDAEATLLRFLSLQTRGVANQKNLLQTLRGGLRATPAPHPDALAAGLAILRETDLRAELPALRQPTLVLSGALDTLTPFSASNWLAGQIAAAQRVELARAGHAPQLSHPDEVVAALRCFCHA